MVGGGCWRSLLRDPAERASSVRNAPWGVGGEKKRPRWPLSGEFAWVLFELRQAAFQYAPDEGADACSPFASLVVLGESGECVVSGGGDAYVEAPCVGCGFGWHDELPLRIL